MTSPRIDLGGSYAYEFIGWAPDRALNPQYDGIPDVERWGALIYCPHELTGLATFDGEVQRRIDPQSPKWTVESFEPLTLSPSIHRVECGCHGFIRQDRWVSA